MAFSVSRGNPKNPSGRKTGAGKDDGGKPGDVRNARDWPRFEIINRDYQSKSAGPHQWQRCSRRAGQTKYRLQENEIHDNQKQYADQT